MNSTEIWALVRTLLSVGGGILVTNHLATAPDVAQASTDLMTIGPALVSLVTIGVGIWRRWNMKSVPEKSVAIALHNVQGLPEVAPIVGSVVNLTTSAKIVGALLLGFILFSAPSAKAATASGPCNIQTLFVGLNAANFLAKLGSCGESDFQAAMDDANSAPVDNGALACLIPATALVKAVAASNGGNTGLVFAFQKFRRAKQSGVVGACISYVNSTLLVQ